MKINRWTTEEVDYLLNNYKEKSYREIANYLNRNEQAIRYKMHALGIKKEIHHCNYNYFENIDSSDKAYWLGFIYADGNINKNLTTLTIALQRNDIKHLENFNKCLQGNYNVALTEKHDREKTYYTCRIMVYSKKMVKDLMNLGVTPHKSSEIKFPNIDKKYIPDFIRGYFDGDGSVCERKHKKYQSDLMCSFTCGSLDFLISLREILFEKDIKTYIVKDNRGNKYNLSCAGVSNPLNFYYYIYDDSNIYLQRKFNKFNSLIERFNIQNRLLRQSERAG